MSIPPVLEYTLRLVTCFNSKTTCLGVQRDRQSTEKNSLPDTAVRFSSQAAFSQSLKTIDLPMYRPMRCLLLTSYVKTQ